MKPLPIILAAVVAGAAAGVVTQIVLRPSPVAGAHEPEVAQVELAGLVRQLQEQQVTLASEIESLRTDQRMETPTSSRVPAEEIEDLVARAIDRRLAPESALKVAGDEIAVASDATEPLDKHVAFDLLLNGDLSQIDREEYWQKVREAGVLDDVIALFEERAELNADDPEAQVELGEAYLQKIFEVGNGPLAGVWATKADGAFDDALALDEGHWDARFSKAASLSFWPPVFGKQAEAIHHFEILVENQEMSTSSPNHAQTYLLLGNLYQQNGRAEDALAAYRKGLERFPDDPGLLQQLAMSEN